eukprot:6646921-Prymnesium_polylepis.1
MQMHDARGGTVNGIRSTLLPDPRRQPAARHATNARRTPWAQLRRTGNAARWDSPRACGLG